MGTKADLRKTLKSTLASLSDQEYEELSLSVSKNFHQLLVDLGVIQKHLTIGVFAPIEREPKWFLEMGLSFEKLTAYPAYVDNKMIFKKAQRSDLEIKKDFGVNILGPKEGNQEVAPEIIIVPGLGFNSGGKRLGRGKGFYDRYLENKSVLKIGIAFEIQMTKDIPTEPHDVLMDYVVTDQCIYKIK